MSEEKAKLDPAHFAKKLNTLTWVLGKLFMAGQKAGLSPDKRVEDAKRELGLAEDLLKLRTKHPELEDSFVKLVAAYDRAEERIGLFVEARNARARRR